MKQNIKNLFVSLAVGLVVGIVTLLLQGVLSANFNFLANSGAVWLVPAFLTTFYFKMNKTFSITNCITCLLGCVFGYYVFEAFHNNHAFIVNRYMMLWIGMAFVAGAVFGLGAHFAHAKNNWLTYAGMNLLPAVFLSEGLMNLIHLDGYRHMVGAILLKILIGILLYAVINQKASFKKPNVFSLLVITTLGIIAFERLFRIT